MNEVVDCPDILLIEPAESGLSEFADRLKRSSRCRRLSMETLAEQASMERLRALKAEQRQPDVICVSADVAHLNSLARELVKLGLDSHLFILLEDPQREQAQRKTLSFLTLSGMRCSMLNQADPGVPRALAEASAAVRQRRRYQTRVARANRTLDTAMADRAPPAASLSDYYLNHFLAYAQDAIVAVDADGKVLYWSLGAEQLFQVRETDAIGCPVKQLPIWSAELERLLQDGVTQTHPTSIESRARVSGGVVQIETLCSAVRDEYGHYVGMSLISRDVSERQRALEEERRRHLSDRLLVETERQKLRKLFEQAPGFVAVTEGPNHVFTIANKAYLEVVGHRPIINQPAAEALPELRGQEFLNLLDHVYHKRQPFVGKAMPLKVAKGTDGASETRYVDFVFQPIIEGDDISGVFCQGSDVTEHRRTQEKLDQHLKNLERLVEERTQELKKSQEALFVSQKLEAIGKLTGGVAHDFNNVLQIIAGNLQLLELHSQNGYDRKRAADHMSAAIDAVTRGKNLSSQLLAFARRQPLQPVPTNLGRLLRNMDHLLRRALGETIEVETVVAGGLWNTSVDPNQLENVILNLALNAKDAMPEGGKLTLEVGNALLDDHYVISQPDVPAGQYVLLAISDTGTGMPPEVIEHAFEPFFTTKKEGEGTGLGLSMAYGFTKQSGGHIRIYSEQGSGTTFKIYLPRSFKAEVETARTGEAAFKGGSETILVVEDDAAVRATAVLMLRELGYKVLQANDGQSALTILQSGVGVDLLFTDVVMPGPVPSTELAARAKALLPNIEVLFTSGYTQNAIVHGGRLDPGVELLSKPYRREDLARKLRQLLESQSGLENSERNPSPVASLQVLLVEDEVDSRSAIAQLLSALGHEVSAVGSAEEALARLQSDNVDLLLTDISLPGMSGLQLIEKAVEMNPGLRVVVASGYNDGITSNDFPDAVSLMKPFDLSALKEALDAAAG